MAVPLSRRVVLGGGVAAAATRARGAPVDFPRQPIHFIVNVPAGGTTDTLARLVGQSLGDLWGQPVIVENKAGGNSAIAAHAVLRAPADGHTLLVTADTAFTTTPFLVKDPAFSIADFAPVGPLARIMPVISLSAKLDARTLPAFVAAARAAPGKFSYGSQGVGAYSHLGMEDLKRRLDLDIQHVPYLGGAQVTQAIIRGDVAILINNYASMKPFGDNGDVVIVATTNAERGAIAPSLPTVAETVAPGFSVGSWFGVFAPARTPPEILARLSEGVAQALAQPAVEAFYARNSLERMEPSPEAFARRVEADAARWRDVIRTAGIAAE